MNGERRLERLLRRETDHYRPATDGFERIQARMKARRRQRLAWRAGAGALAVVVVAAGVVVATTGGHRPNGRQTTVAVGGGPISTAAQGPGVLVSVTRDRVEWLSPTDGHVQRAVPVALPSRPVGQIAATPSGSTVYVTVIAPAAGGSACNNRIIAVDTSTGVERTIATDASAPAVNRSGTALAYLAFEGPAVGPAKSNCVAREVVVQGLTGQRERRSFPTARTEKMGLDEQQLLSLSWAPTGPDLLIGSEFGPESGIQVLDSAQSGSMRNVAGIRPDDWGAHRGTYADPVEEANGTLVAVGTSCSGTTSCAPGPVPEIDTLNRRTGQPVKVLDALKRVTGLVPDPAGDKVLAEVPVNRSGTMLRLVLVGHHGTKTVATVNGPVAWVTGQVPMSPPATTAPKPTTNSSPTTPAPPTTQAAKPFATLHLSSHVITAGGKLRATITVDNWTGRALHDGGCGSLFNVVLGNAAHPNVPGELTCIRGYTIRPGRSIYHVQVITGYVACGGTGNPRCPKTGMPPLPPGEYQTKVYEQGHAVPVPAPQNVRVRAR